MAGPPKSSILACPETIEPLGYPFLDTSNWGIGSNRTKLRARAVHQQRPIVTWLKSTAWLMGVNGASRTFHVVNCGLIWFNVV